MLDRTIVLPKAGAFGGQRHPLTMTSQAPTHDRVEPRPHSRIGFPAFTTEGKRLLALALRMDGGSHSGTIT